MADRERVRAGGRSERVRQQVAAACLSLLAEGRTDLSPSAVAQRSGVTRATVYRWWPTKVDLLHEALTAHTAHRIDPVDTGSWEGDVHTLARRLAACFADPAEVSLNVIMATGADAEYDRVVLAHYEPIFAAWRAVVTRAQQRGELEAGVDPDTVVMAIAAPMVVTPLLFHRAVGAGAVRRLADLVAAGARGQGASA